MKIMIAVLLALGLASSAGAAQWWSGLAGAAQGMNEARTGQPHARVIGYYFDDDRTIDTGLYRICYYHVPGGIEAQTMPAANVCPTRVNFPF